MFLPFPSWQQLVGFITSATVLSFGSGPIVLAAMRRQLPDYPRPFKLPGGDVIAFLAFYCSNLIVFWAGWATNWKLFIAVALGFVMLLALSAFVYWLALKVRLPESRVAANIEATGAAATQEDEELGSSAR